MINEPKVKKDKYGFVDVKLGPSKGSYRETDNNFEIYSVRTPIAYRGSGHAKRLMDHIIQEVDKSEKPAKLIASPLDSKTSTQKLVDFYGKYGFSPTGEKANPAGDPWMVRPAKKQGGRISEKDNVVKKALYLSNNYVKNNTNGSNGLKRLLAQIAKGGR